MIFRFIVFYIIRSSLFAWQVGQSGENRRFFRLPFQKKAAIFVQIASSSAEKLFGILLFECLRRYCELKSCHSCRQNSKQWAEHLYHCYGCYPDNSEDCLRLPSFDCPNPNCAAKNIAFAISREAKNESELIPLEYASEDTPADFVDVCPKCKGKSGLCRHKESTVVPFYYLPLYGRVAI